MGFWDFLLGKDPKDSLPPWLKNWTPPPGYMDYLTTGYKPGESSSSYSSSLTNSSTNSNTKGMTTNQFMNMPFITKDYAPLATLQRDTIFSRLANGGLPEGYLNEGLRNIGWSGTINADALANDLTSRGLGRLTGAGRDVLAANQDRAQASFLNSLPMLARENQTQDLGLAQGAIGAFGRGEVGQSMGTNQSTTNSNTRSQTDSNSGSSSSGGLDYGGIGQLMSSLMPYYTSGRQGGLLSYLPSILGLFGGGGGSKPPSSPPFYGYGIGYGE